MFDSFLARPARTTRIVGLLALTLIFASSPWTASADASEKSGEDAAKIEEKVSMTLDAWLIAGPQDQTLPATLRDKPEHPYSMADLLDEKKISVSDLHPASGRTVGIDQGAAWHPVELKDGSVHLKPHADHPRTAWLATWIEAHRFTSSTLKLTSNQRLKIFIDGAEVAKAAELDSAHSELKQETSPGKITEAGVHLDTGSHLVLIESLAEAGADTWTLSGVLEIATGFEEFITVGTDPARGLNLNDVLDTRRTSNLRLSPDGRYLMVSNRQPLIPTEENDSWTDIVDIKSGDVIRSLRGEESNIDWLPGTGTPEIVFSVTSGTNEKASHIYRSALLSGARKLVAADIEHLAELKVIPDGSGLIAEITVPQEADERGVKRYRNLPDRWSGWRDPSFFVGISWQGTRRRLTAGSQSTDLQDIRHDGRALLLSREEHGSTERPYSFTELSELDLDTLKKRSIATMKWFGDATYSPDGKTLLVTGSPVLFGELGNNSSDHEFANNYDTQAYLMPVADPTSVRAITLDFNPSLRDAVWSRDDSAIYFSVQDRTWNRVFRYDPEGDGSFVQLPSGADTVSSVSVKADQIAYVGSSPNRPYAIFTQSTQTDAKPRVLLDPSVEQLADVTYGEVKTWTFTSSAGDDILGRMYYPRNFDPAKTYPLIVYYYGGTVPVERSFAGRYPKELWAANGYVVYVPQPSGADGFGQEFSARHVNAWGKRTADEIIEGTQKLLAEHDFLDPKRVGCTGASYGGFMTMYLQTRTDLFAAAISHAGISNIASYWGKGWWGYLYSAAATAESFPWNNRELYIDQSPLFSADKIQTPLLLLHGDADTNVPNTESHQMYTALKVLGKEVELIEIGGENHGIVSYPKRKLWSQTIIAWFDRWLKQQPESWQHLWGDEADPKG